MDRHFYESINGGKTTCIDDDIPFDIPDSWEWVRLGEILSVISDGTHKTPTYVENGIPFLSVQNISSGTFTFSPIKYVSPDEHKRLCARIRPSLGDVLVCRIGTLGKAIVNTLDFEFSIFVSLGLLRPVDLELSEYITFVINSAYGDNWIAENKVGGGTHTNKINLSTFPTLLIPLPSTAEQKRIAIAIKERYQLLESIHSSRLRYKRVLYKTPTSLRQQLIQAAIQGLLVPQNPSDEPASVLLASIAKERTAKLGSKAAKSMSRIERRGSKTYELFPDGTEKDISDEIPFDIPDCWEWSRLQSYCLYGEAASIKVKDCSPNTWVLDLEDIVAHAGHITRRVSAIERPSFSNKYSFEEGSVLYSKLRPYLNKVVVAEECGCCTTEIIPIRLFSGSSPYFLQQLMMSSFFVSEINKNSYGVKMPRADTKKVKDFLLPIPPLQEQHRIVEKLGALLKLV